MSLYHHVFSGEGDFYVADTNEGEDVLAQVAAEDPTAEIMIQDRDTDAVLIDRQPLREYLDASEPDGQV